MRRLLKFTNYAAQRMALIDLVRAIKRWATKNDIKKQKERPEIKTQMTYPLQKVTNHKKKRNRLISQRFRFLVYNLKLATPSCDDSQKKT